MKLTLNDKERDEFLKVLESPPKANEDLKALSMKLPTFESLEGEIYSTAIIQILEYLKYLTEELEKIKK